MSRSRNKSAAILLVAIATAAAFAVADIQQTVQKDSIGVVNTGGGTVIIGYTIEQHEKSLKAREAQLRGDLKTLYSPQIEAADAKRAVAERELTEVRKQLLDLHSSYQDRIHSLENTIAELKSVGSNDGDKRDLAEAIAAAQRGDTSKADAIFARVEKNAQADIVRAATAAYQRGVIANDKPDYRSAYEHFKRAAELELVVSAG